jgi:protein-tyrosine phosphatase
MLPAETVLFLCTGNYYRSRLAEHYFNALAAEQRLAWRADSRGLRINPLNYGPISQDTLVWLGAKGIAVAEPLRFPLPVTDSDLRSARIVVALKEAEHRPLLEENFPSCLERVEFWNVHDLDMATPEEALPELAANVERLVARLARQNALA